MVVFRIITFKFKYLMMSLTLITGTSQLMFESTLSFPKRQQDDKDENKAQEP